MNNNVLVGKKKYWILFIDLYMLQQYPCMDAEGEPRICFQRWQITVDKLSMSDLIERDLNISILHIYIF